MAASFFEVFPVLKLNKGMMDLLEEATVEKVTASQARNRIRVYLCSPRLISYEEVRKLEDQIRGQLFENTDVHVDIIDRYELSEQYTPERLMSIYFDSFEAELKDSSDLEANIFHKAKKEFIDAQRMVLTVEDNFITASKIECIRSKLLKIFQDRFGYYVDISVEYVRERKSRQAEYAEETFQREVETIVKNYAEAEAAVKQKEEKIAEQQKPTRDFKKENTYVKKKIIDPDIFYGRPFEGDETPISEINDEIGEVIVRGKIIQMETREIRNEKTIIIFAVTDFTDSITAKIFTKNEFLPQVLSNLKVGKFVRMKAMAVMDKYDHGIALNSVTGIKNIPDFTKKRMDLSPVKRVELHAHTTMSDMDSVADCKAMLKTAMSWGHKAMAITDHGVVQAFTDANHCVEGTDFKPIYGVEGYLVDDLKPIVFESENQSLDSKFVVFDIETTGFSAVNDRIIEIGAVKVENGEIVDRYSTFVNPERPIPFEIEKLTGINDGMVVDAAVIEDILPEFLAFSEDCIMVAHNAEFDMSFIKENCRRMNLLRKFTVVDTLAMARSMLPDLKNYKLDTVVEAVGGTLENHHRAVEDAESTADIFVKFVARLKGMGVTDLDTLNGMSQMSVNAIKKLKTYHIIILAQNDIGRINLYRLVSWSHLDYYARRPRIPKSVLAKYREGLIIGSACEAGELYQAVLNDRPSDEIARIVSFYDYLEIQPIGNNLFMIESEKIPQIQSKEDLMEMNRKIVRLGEQFHKPVCATCDVHFINPEDEVYRRIIMAGKGFDDADRQPPIYFRTTEEMLEEFMYLGAEKAEEVVITNTNYIADQIERISPVRPDKCPPVIENSDKTLRTICYDKAHALYGENLPEIVVERLERELNSIIGNGFAVMYIIAQKLVWKSVADGYLVGSRGSVGSSFAAFTAGITEVNSLPAHYLCPNCKYVDFDSDYVKSFSGRSGCDMEDKVCPVCGTPLSKEGHDIPFETFLGFKGNKEPDIDLNFSGEYQSKAHDYTEVIFGKGQTFRAGTIGTLAEKTAYGYARGYFEDHHMEKRSCELTRLASGCVGVRRTTGQHPGGIIVVPLGEEIYSFTPVQHPANDQTTHTITTHFDYHSIDHNLLKLDILGHDDPTMIRMLQDITGVDPTTISLDDQEVLSLFHGLDALHIQPEDIGGTDLGSLGIPEFGTDFVMQMLRDTKPKAFSDLVRISGLSHGTDVWLNNAQTLIKEGKAEISTAICTRDDIMIYLINKGVESELSFKIMESVRKGKGLTPEFEAAMKEHDVPDWYIWSCKKIKYMFPKAHAVAYVMMGFRIAWFKIHYPLAYYAAFFTIRATAFDYELMCRGKEELEKHLKLYKSNPNLTAKEKDTIRDMKIVQEFYARGFDFLPIDLYRSEAVKFTIVGDKLLPPFSSIDGMGGIAAEALALAAKDGPFISKDDIAGRAKVSRSTLDVMGELGLLGDLPESNQLSIFDLKIG
ncbi:PolC-type DNA polymerase III [Frisingicoccus caecimuris]|uniref:DNA polymerase III PolC-type n=1 Tax=Frisingicoccus caecimuris TaxID=1796636 RepID=A0A4R2L925_9FIRM|nr:PolC-type DNA polymerase III [Frisingicoccus caecimuris]MCR1919322.1 PolC-type DNA polymerase III [Frisingicoccus caecimuris]TCO84186.1 DNA polymerase III catalytic subunit PolC type [Frisingicoccus caecimuris]